MARFEKRLKFVQDVAQFLTYNCDVVGQDEGRKLSSIDGINYCYILKKFPQLIT